MRRLDEYVGWDVRAMKVDVEGFEPGVLEGASGVFARHKIYHMMLEFFPSLMAVHWPPERVRGGCRSVALWGAGSARWGWHPPCRSLRACRTPLTPAAALPPPCPCDPFRSAPSPPSWRLWATA